MSRRSQLVYGTGLLTVAAALAALAVVRVPITIRSDGIIRPAIERHELRVPTAGVVAGVPVRLGSSVAAGAPLLVLQAPAIDARVAQLNERLRERADAAADLDRLQAAVRSLLADAPAAPSVADALPLRTPRARRELARLLAAADEIRLRLARAEREAERVRALAARGFATPVEVEERANDAARARAELASLRERAREEWAAQAQELRLELGELAARRREVADERARLVLRAPVGGTVEELAAVSPGSVVAPGDRLAVVSPAAGLIADLWVRPRDVGLLKRGMPVRLLVDAFDHTEWGVVTGRVAHVPDDVVLAGQTPVFRVRASLDRTALSLPNGVRGTLRKGMTVRARFVVAERTLWQLLRDDVADWMQPGREPRDPGEGGAPTTSPTASATATGDTRRAAG